MNRTFIPLSVLLAACGGAAVSTVTPAPSSQIKIPGVVWPDEGVRKWAPRPTETAITANDLRTRLYQISDDSMMGRRIGEEGNFKATSYIAREFERLGLKPGGDNGTYFQQMAYGPRGYDSTKATMIVAGAALEKKREWMPLAPNPATGIAGAAMLQNVPTVFAGRWGDTTTVLDAAALRGRVAVFSAPVVPPAPAGGRAGGAGAGGFASVRDNRARDAGAVGVIVASMDGLLPTAGPAAFNMTAGMHPVLTTGLVAASVTSAAAAKIMGRPLADATIGMPGQPVSATWTYEMRLPQFPARNVIAILHGSDPARAGEYVLVGAHNDHVGTNARGEDHDSLRAYNRVMRPQGANDPRGTPTSDQRRKIDSLIAYARSIRAPRRDSIMNGADDDGSGTVVLLEIAEQFAKERPARSIIFVSHQGEEAGLLGSAWFVSHPTVPIKQIVSAINMDMLGKGRVTDVQFGGPNSVQSLGSRRISPEFGDIIDSVNAISPRPMAIDRSWDTPANKLNRFCRSDQVNYVNAD
ncbi:MAG: M28 family peptidase, partial [Longimicrobiales bacterium]